MSLVQTQGQRHESQVLLPNQHKNLANYIYIEQLRTETKFINGRLNFKGIELHLITRLIGFSLMLLSTHGK